MARKKKEDVETKVEDEPVEVPHSRAAEPPKDEAVEPPKDETVEPPKDDRREKFGKEMRTIKNMDLKPEWKDKLIETEMKALAALPPGVARESVLVQYRPEPGEPIKNALIIHNKKLLEEAWTFYKENEPNANEGKFLDTFISAAGISKSSYKKVQFFKLGE